MRVSAYLAIALLCVACSTAQDADPADEFSPLAEAYVKLALAMGEHDADYVDAYFGPADWREQAAQSGQSLAEIASAATRLAAQVRAIQVSSENDLLLLRQDYLGSHLESMAAIASMRDGEVLSFDEESRRVYGFVAPSFPREHYEAALAKIADVLPGDGPLYERVNEFELQFRIPGDSIEAVVRAGIDECRKRTLQHMSLPEGEAFQFELVKGNPWDAYNWYQGNYQGLIQVEVTRPKTVFSATRLGCHEGYPGHHAFSSSLDQKYLQQRGWIEFSVLPLFSPQGVVFEGSGDFAEVVAFPGSSKTAFLRDVVLPIAGIGDVDFETRSRYTAAAKELRYAGIEAARKYLDGDWQAFAKLLSYPPTPLLIAAD